MVVEFDHVRQDRRMKTSALVGMVQNAMLHNMEPGCSVFNEAHKKGLFLILIQQHFKIYRRPRLGEKLVITVNPGRKMHMLFPLFCAFRDEQDELVLESNSIWVLIDPNTRELAAPEEHEMSFPFDQTKRELSCMDRIRSVECIQSYSFTVPRSYIDLNGHMNNTRYYDVVEDHFPNEVIDRELREIRVEFTEEAMLGDEIAFHWGVRENEVYVAGEKGERPCFKMLLTYE